MFKVALVTVDIYLIPIQCRLNNASLTDVLDAANHGASSLPVDFRLAPPHDPGHLIEIHDLFEYAAELFGPNTIIVTSRKLGSESADYMTAGLTDSEYNIALARAEPGLSRRQRNRGFATTIIHEYLHLMGLDHHTRKTYSHERRLCPFMHLSASLDTALVPCKKCIAAAHV